jgi:hypothetical protein
MIERIEADVTKYPELDSIFVDIRGLNKDGHTIFSFHLGHSGTKKDWESLLEACHNETDGEYILYHDDTEDIVHAFKEWVSFELHARYNTSHMAFTVPKTACIDAFKNVYNSFNEN